MEIKSKCSFTRQTANFKKLIRDVNVRCFVFGITLDLKYSYIIVISNHVSCSNRRYFTWRNLTKRELFLFSGVSAFPKISNKFIAVEACFIIFPWFGLFWHMNCVRCCVVCVFPEPDSPVIITHCGVFCSFKALIASAPTRNLNY